MTYEKKMSMTREALTRLDIYKGPRHLNMSGDWELPQYMSEEFSKLFSEHGARGALTSMGMQLGINKDVLTFLGRWVPKDSVEDYTRESRSAVSKVTRHIAAEVGKGWRPDETVMRDRGVHRGAETKEADMFFLHDAPLAFSEDHVDPQDIEEKMTLYGQQQAGLRTVVIDQIDYIQPPPHQRSP